MQDFLGQGRWRDRPEMTVRRVDESETSVSCRPRCLRVSEVSTELSLIVFSTALDTSKIFVPSTVDPSAGG